MQAAQPRPRAPTIFSSIARMLFASLAVGAACAVFAINLISTDRLTSASYFLVFWSGIFLSVRSRWRQPQQRRLLWMFALVLALLYALIIVAFIWYLPLALSLLGSFLALLVIISFAQWMKPSKKSDWLLMLGCGLLGGTATALIFWLMLGPGVINLPMLLVLVLAAGLAGPTGGALRWAFDALWPLLRRGRALDAPEQPPTPASASLSRREMLLGLSGLAGLAVTGASFTWLTRSLLAHAFPLVTYRSLGQVKELSWSPDGRRIVSATDFNVAIWDATNGKEIFGPN
jgi:hypothetical protein